MSDSPRHNLVIIPRMGRNCKIKAGFEDDDQAAAPSKNISTIKSSASASDAWLLPCWG